MEELNSSFSTDSGWLVVWGEVIIKQNEGSFQKHQSCVDKLTAAFSIRLLGKEVRHSSTWEYPLFREKLLRVEDVAQSITQTRLPRH